MKENIKLAVFFSISLVLKSSKIRDSLKYKERYEKIYEMQKERI